MLLYQFFKKWTSKCKVKAEKINQARIKYLDTDQWKNSSTVIEWPKSIDNKKDWIFISIFKVVLYHQISAKSSNLSRILFLCVYMQNSMQIPVKQLVFPDHFTFPSFNCFTDRSSLKIYVTTPIAMVFTLLFGPHLALNLPDFCKYLKLLILSFL